MASGARGIGALLGHGLVKTDLVDPRDFGWLSLAGAVGTVLGDGVGVALGRCGPPASLLPLPAHHGINVVNVGTQHEATAGKRGIANPSIGSAIATYLRRLARHRKLLVKISVLFPIKHAAYLFYPLLIKYIIDSFIPARRVTVRPLPRPPARSSFQHHRVSERAVDRPADHRGVSRG